MKDRAEFETAVSIYAGEAAQFRRYFLIWLIPMVAWLIALPFFHPLSLPTVKFGILVVGIPIVLFVALILKARRLDATADRVGLRCPKCRRWFWGQVMANHVRS